jgi:anti-sigma28 factor (negative regulator of flagellin synthesis)
LSETGKNAEKISALRAQIKSGEYIVSSLDIAAAIISGS